MLITLEISDYLKVGLGFAIWGLWDLEFGVFVIWGFWVLGFGILIWDLGCGFGVWGLGFGFGFGFGSAGEIIYKISN